ncbi:nucleosome-destabilizing factor isoform X2 [Musca autumnalis]|uniref:nucleosome-destabilizing factor isoform X2 n=1 Tax=Musca autumnalis TaxID=221902 RepID=UPI003CE9FECE
MSKTKKQSLSGGGGNGESLEILCYKPKDLVWAKMKGFAPWPAMIVEPPLELLNNTHKTNSKCVFFFGSRNFAWIESSHIKPFEGPWKEQLSKLNKPASFRQAMEDIKKHMDDPTEIDELISKSTGIRSQPTEADFDKIRDGYTTEDENTIDTNANNVDNNNGEISDVDGNDKDGVETTTLVTKTPAKRVPKAKASTAPSSKAAKSTLSKASTKRRASQTPATTKRKRNETTPPHINNDYLEETTSPRRRILTEALAHIGGNVSPPRRNNTSIALLERPHVRVPETQTIDMSTRSQTLAERDIVPSDLTFGFLGLGIMGSTIVKDLICTGHKVVVWNRTMSKCEPFREAGADVKETPEDVVNAADIIFCCVSDPKASKDLVFGNCGVLRADLCNKAYVEMSTIDPETSQDIAEGITQSNGRYLEVQIHGTRQEAEDGMLIILAGGDRTVFDECQSCFKTIAKNTFFLGDVGNACKVNLILQTILGVSLVGLSEALALADRFSISLKDILDIFQLTSMKSDLLLAKGREMAKGDFNPQQPLSHMQKDLRLVLSMAENLDQSMPVTSITNEVFKHTKRLGYSEHDSSAVFINNIKIDAKLTKNSAEQEIQTNGENSNQNKETTDNAAIITSPHLQSEHSDGNECKSSSASPVERTMTTSMVTPNGHVVAQEEEEEEYGNQQQTYDLQTQIYHNKGSKKTSRSSSKPKKKLF